MIRIAGIVGDDVVNGEGVSVSLFLQGCPFHCKGCHNPETWDPKGGIPRDYNDLINEILEKLSKNGINRNLNILGGETLDSYEKIEFLNLLLPIVRKQNPDIKILLWSGYTLDKILEMRLGNILNNIDYLIDGPFKIEERDITLKWRGSRNQRIIDIKNGLVIID